MATMKRSAKLDGVGNVVLEEVPIPTPGEGEVLVRLKASLISRGSEILGRYMNPSAVDPSAMGYSAAGVVEEVGSGVTGLAPGDRVGVVAPHAEFVIGLSAPAAAKQSLVRLPDDVTFEQATFIPLTTSSCAWTHSALIEHGHTVAVLGQGLVGSLMLQVIKSQRDATVIAVDAEESRCKFARRFGADLVVNCANDDPVAAVREFTGGAGADVTVDCVGGRAGLKSFAQAQDMTRREGVIELVGLYHGDPLPLDASKIMTKLIVGGIRSPKTRPEYVEDAVRLIQQGTIKADDMITHRFQFQTQAKEAFDLLAERLGEALGVVFQYE